METKFFDLLFIIPQTGARAQCAFSFALTKQGKKTGVWKVLTLNTLGLGRMLRAVADQKQIVPTFSSFTWKCGVNALLGACGVF